ncbi:PLP-dependent aspartate aminotransferase family protein [Rothia sp. HMSC061C12]|jgi:cystathionine beta-lyase/cystathionine gamma-synthase|uniref:trans-sulfuration enzyme family protein n=1 Tax=Rothia sp. HMSC061C12 TaxID=1739547 RepID=UPI0008A383E6|nr:PLP-dependent aspartate aminotransferase family protein [Rothia sp. HMSC061C12]OFO19807.1 cystathionine gamma-synthase [Rothia sp. HMSC061C12]
MSQQNQLEPTGFTTRTIHAVHDARYDASVPPVYLASTFGTAGEDTTYMYQRGANPTRDNLQATLAALEGAEHAYAYPSGMAATAAALGVLEAGDTLLLGMPTYGGTYRFATTELTKRAVKTRFISDFTALSDEDFTPDVKVVFLETPTNPTLQVTDIDAVAELAHRHGALLIVDNTFMTPYLQRPLELGADITVQSATKFLAGHADLLAGVAATNDPDLAILLHRGQLVSGALLPPIDSYRLLQDVKTLALRLERQQQNARELIEFLSERPEVEKIFYAGNSSEEQAEVQSRQARGIGSVFSLLLKDGGDAQAFARSLPIFVNAVSLGGIESLVSLPAHTTHGAYAQEHRDEFGVDDRLVRLAIGIEDVQDLIAALEIGLKAAFAG